MQSKKTPFSKRMFYVIFPFVLPLCLIALGILLQVNEKLVNGIFTTLGILIAVIGLIEVVVYASRRQCQPPQPAKTLTTGIILLILGALLIILPFTINKLIPIILGICVLCNGISGIVNTMEFRKADTNIVASMLFAVTHCLLGIFILIYVIFINQNTGWNIIGILMIISGVLRMINEIVARLAPKYSGNVVETSFTKTTITDADTDAAGEAPQSPEEQ